MYLHLLNGHDLTSINGHFNVQAVNMFMINGHYHMDCYVGRVRHATVIIKLQVESFYNCPTLLEKSSINGHLS